MYTLIIDSATKVLYLSLVKDLEVVEEKYIKSINGHSSVIISEIDNMFKNKSIVIDNISKIIVGVGPGSYTGVRMGVVIAKMFSTFKNIELFSISTLKLMASGSEGIVCPMIDARRGNSFSCVYDNVIDKFILNEGLYENLVIVESNNQIVSESDYKVDVVKVIKRAVKVNNPHILTPNYLRDTEAERNLNGNS